MKYSNDQSEAVRATTERDRERYIVEMSVYIHDGIFDK